MKPRLPRFTLAVFGLVFTLFSHTAANADEAPAIQLEPIIVTAERIENPLFTSTTAVSVLTAAEIQRFPLANFSDALSALPGIAFHNRDGLGRDPIANLRGFYGGGEVEYLQVLMDGKPLNDVETGLMNWNAVPLSSVESIEFLRGGASSLYGDSAIGGVVNILTRKNLPSTRLSISGGTFGSLNAQLRTDGAWNGRRYGLFTSEERNTGFRDHADREVENVGASFSMIEREDATLSISTAHNFRRFDEPGPLSGAELEASRSQSSPFYKFDHTTDRRHRGAVAGQLKVGEGVELSGTISGEIRDADVVRTLPLSPQFVDTKNRLLSTSRLTTSLQLTFDTTPIPVDSKLIVGVDAGLHSLSSEYYQFFLGGEDSYKNASSPERGDLDEQGDGNRRAIAGFLQYELTPIQRLRVVLGGRFDAIRDEFTPKPPSQGEKQSTTHSVFSPKAGANFRYLDTTRQVGNLYANVSRSFKTPTLDQLYDQRSIPVEFPPFKITLSNGELKPQFGTSLEIGAYHRSAILPDWVFGQLSLSAYTMEMEDELDFDLQQFKYVNIGKSRHRGVEAGLKVSIKSSANLFLNYTHQSATSQIGDTKGNFLKAIPRDVIVGGVHAAHQSGVGGGVVIRSANRIFLDDANTITLPNHTTVDARIGYQLGLISATLDVFNLLDKAYSTTGFPDSSGSDVVYFYPAAGRRILFSLNIELGRFKNWLALPSHNF